MSLMDAYLIKPAHNGEEIHTANLSFDFHHPAHISLERDLITAFLQTF